MLANTEMQIRVLQALEWEPSLDAALIGVAARDGVVTLAGTVRSWADRLTAERVVKRLSGVKAVSNELEVRLTVDSRRSDAELVHAALQALEWDVQVPAGRITVRVANGWLSLGGEVDWQYQREAAERCVRHLTGVRGVSNLITLAARPTPTDLKRRIEQALRRHAELEARAIRVEASGGRVTLDGAVHSFAERDEAERAVWGAPGVTVVEDHLVVSSA